MRVDLVTRRGEFAVRGGILDVFAARRRAPGARRLLRRRARAAASTSRSPTSARCPETLTAHRAAAEPRAAAHRERAAARRARWSTSSRPWRRCSRRSPRASRSRAWSRSPPRCCDSSCRSPTTCLGMPRSPSWAPSASRPGRSASPRRTASSSTPRGTPRPPAPQAPIDLDAGDFLTVSGLRAAAGDRAPGGRSALRLRRRRRHPAAPPIRCRRFVGQADGAIDHVAALARDGWQVDGHGERRRPRRARRRGARRPRVAVVAVEQGAGRGRGSSWPDDHLRRPRAIAVISEAEFYGRSAGIDSRQVKRLASRRKNVVDPLQLRAGRLRRAPDPRHRPVRRARAARGRQRHPHPARSARHHGHRGEGRARVPRASSTRRPSAAIPGDKLYVPTDQLDLLTRYVGGEAPALSKMGGSDWAAAKGKARKAVRDIAVELVKLYSARMASAGHAFPPDTPWQRELEEAFPFVETPDQLHHHRRGEGRHGAADPDGPARLGRRRLRQDRDRGARRVQGGAGRQAGRDARADDAARAAAHGDLRRAVRRVPGAPAGAEPVPDRQGGEGDDRGPGERHRSMS